MSAGSQYILCMPDWVYRSNHGQSLNFFCHCTTTSTKLGNVSELGGEFWKENFEKWIFKARNIHPIMTMFVWIKRCIFWIFIFKIHPSPKLNSTLKGVNLQRWFFNSFFSFKIHLPKFTLAQSWFQLWKGWFLKGEFFHLIKFTLFKVEINFRQNSPP